MSGRNKIYAAIKRALDILFSCLGLVLCLIPVALACAAVYRDEPGPVIFCQKRVGRNEKIFTLYKIRTMRTAVGAGAAEIGRVTAVGRFLRRSSMDELPQLWNVLKGDMSLIGPRPLIPEEEKIHALRRQYGVYELRPGLTGLAQICGRDRLGAEEKCIRDREYLENYGFCQDLRILAVSLIKVLRCEDVAEKK